MLSKVRRLRSKTTWRDFQFLLRRPQYRYAKVTPRRLLNLYLVRFQKMRAQEKVLGYPVVLTIESANICNLACPYCFTGAGEVSRTRGHFPLPLYERLMNELGSYLFEVELHNWGEPLLNKNLPQLIKIAADKGAQTTISTNFSFPFDEARAEALVAAGLSQLGVSLDGATQETYEQYRVKGKFDLVLDNVRRVIAAKERLRSDTPRIVWEFHVFEHNAHEVETARALAKELGVAISVIKGWTAGPEWDRDGPYRFYQAPAINACEFLWQRAIVNVDGGVAPCCGTFYKEDDFGSVESIGFKNVWNNENFRNARRLFKSQEPYDPARSLICYDCPATLTRQDYLAHLARGGSRYDFKRRFTTNDSFNYFFNRRPGGVPKPQPMMPPDAIQLETVNATSRGSSRSS